MHAALDNCILQPGRGGCYTPVQNPALPFPQENTQSHLHVFCWPAIPYSRGGEGAYPR